MDKIFRGIVKYRQTLKPKLVEQMKNASENPDPKAVWFTCVDSRLQPANYTQTEPGDVFVVRNVGNCLPKSADNGGTETAMLELGCKMLKIKNVVVCGHSDCKALHFLYALHKGKTWSPAELSESPMKSWLHVHALDSLRTFEELEKDKFKRPLLLDLKSGQSQVEAFVNLERNDVDKLSQVHSLLQMQKVAKIDFLRPLLDEGQVALNAFWFDISSGEVNIFSQEEKHFVPIVEGNHEDLLKVAQHNLNQCN